MADYATRRTMMVDTQVRPSDVTKFPIIDAMLSVPREEYLPADKAESAYVGGNITLSGGRSVLEPRTFAKMLDALTIDPADVVLDLGCGLGYSTAVLAQMADFVVAVEDDSARVSEAQQNLSSHGVDNAAVVEGPLAEGAKNSGPYDIILLQGGAEQVPAALLDQLKDGGRIAVVFCEGALGVVRIGHKLNGTVTWRFSFNAGAPVAAGFENAAAFAL
ncbi:MAG: protein-L-isoaspartate(D-aspartate) O-methyltransferase [Paracoccaceae bacterium]